jgi:hypothetical protein
MHRDLTWNFSFWRPINWHQATLTDPHGVAYYPEDDPRTGFYVTVTDLGETLESGITEDDMLDLHQGLREGLAQLPDGTIHLDQQIVKEQAIGYEFLLTFSQNDLRFKQRLRMLYLGTRQYTIYGQGTPPGEYDVFANIFDYMYLTFTFGDLLLDMGVPPMPDVETPYIPPEG